MTCSTTWLTATSLHIRAAFRDRLSQWCHLLCGPVFRLPAHGLRLKELVVVVVVLVVVVVGGKAGPSTSLRPLSSLKLTAEQQQHRLWETCSGPANRGYHLMFLIYAANLKTSNIPRHHLTHAECFCHYTLLWSRESSMNKWTFLFEVVMGGFVILLFKYLFPKGHKYDGDQICCWFNHSTTID